MKAGLIGFLAFLFGFCEFVANAFAHPLPNSSITIARQAENIEVSLSIPLLELVAAEPLFADLKSAKAGLPLSAAAKEQISAYLLHHIALAPDGSLPLSFKIESVVLIDATHEDVGHYNILVVKLSAILTAHQLLFPAKLAYDAVLHKVRNHRATVWYGAQGAKPKHLGEIRFDPKLGKGLPLKVLAIP